MRAEAKELYFHTKNVFMDELKRISPTCISPIIAIRQVVKKAIDRYISDYCTNNEDPFTQEDFKSVSDKLNNEILNNELE